MHSPADSLSLNHGSGAVSEEFGDTTLNTPAVSWKLKPLTSVTVRLSDLIGQWTTADPGMSWLVGWIMLDPYLPDTVR